MTPPSGKYFLLWKGRQSGPFALEEIHAKLSAGEISRMHQISVHGSWQVLDGFLEKLRQAELARPLFPPHPPQAPPAPSEQPVRTSGLAMAALGMALCNFIPYVNFISWILALVFGHMALAQMKRDESLEGRWLAITALVITYFLVVLVLTFIVLMLANHQKLPFF